MHDQDRVPQRGQPLRLVERGQDDLGADGVVLLANSRGTYLGDPAFEPLMAELDRRSAVLFVHPAELPAPAVPGLPPFAPDLAVKYFTEGLDAYDPEDRELHQAINAASARELFPRLR